MKAAVVTGPGRTPDFTDFPEPVATAGEIVVTVAAAALSPLARARASGTHYSSGGAFPFVAGVDGVGTTADGGRVYFLLPGVPHGAMAERTVVAASQVIPLPDDLDDVTAATIANPGMSSWAALTRRAALRSGETVLVNGATGASGRLAVKIARYLGAAKVVATGRNATVLARLGADVTIALGDGDAADRFAAILRDRVDVVIDYLWGDSAAMLLRAAGTAATTSAPIRFVQVGTASGSEITLPGAVLRSTGIVLMGSGIGSLSLGDLVAAVDGVLHVAGAAGLTLPVTVVPLAEVATAWGRADDRIVFTPH